MGLVLGRDIQGGLGPWDLAWFANYKGRPEVISCFCWIRVQWRKHTSYSNMHSKVSARKFVIQQKLRGRGGGGGGRGGFGGGGAGGGGGGNGGSGAGGVEGVDIESVDSEESRKDRKIAEDKQKLFKQQTPWFINRPANELL